VHFGGGSPTSLTAADFQAVVNRIKQHFAITADAEIAVELDPRTATPDYVKAMADVGVNRASLGVQDFHPDVQKAINRIQPYAQVAEVIAWLRHNGITDLNMDLVYGLPHQTTDTLLETIDMTLALQPKRVSLFGYAHVPWMKTHQKLIPESVLPQAEARWHQYEAATQHFKDKGYVAVGLDHFAAPDDPLAIALGNGTLNRNFQGYTTDTAEALIGLGASGIGSLPSGYVANEAWRAVAGARYCAPGGD
jgi:oxygen-independent coproporphyrinogen-3 oxidase